MRRCEDEAGEFTVPLNAFLCVSEELYLVPNTECLTYSNSTVSS